MYPNAAQNIDIVLFFPSYDNNLAWIEIQSVDTPPDVVKLPFPQPEEKKEGIPVIKRCSGLYTVYGTYVRPMVVLLRSVKK